MANTPVEQLGAHVSVNSRKHRWLRWAVIALALVMYLAGSGRYALLDPDEGRYAEIPREMLASGDFVTPRLNHVIYFEKPPLFYWLTAASMRALGQNEFAVRLVPALVGLATLLLTVALASALAGEAAGALAGWIYLTAILPLVMARLPVIDGLFSLLLAASWAAWWFGYATPQAGTRRGWFALSWASLGLAVLAKGPVAVMLSTILVLGFLCLRREIRVLRAMFWWPGPLAFVIVVLPWHIMVSLRNPEFLHYFIVVQHIERFLGRSQEHVKPFWFFIPIFIFGLGAWWPLAFPAAAACWRKARLAMRLTGAQRAPAEAGTPAQAASLYLLWWVAVIIGFFSASACKLVPYILPAFPAAAVLLAMYISEPRTGRKTEVACATLSVAFLLILVVAARMGPMRQHDVPPPLLQSPAFSLQVALLFSVAFISVAAWRRRWLTFATGLPLVLSLPMILTSMTVISNHRKAGPLVKAFRPLPGCVRVAEWGCYDQSLGFYTRRRVTLVDAKGELALAEDNGRDRGFFLRGKESVARLAREGPLLLNVEARLWAEMKSLGTLQPVAANTGNLFLANAELIGLVGLVPWPAEVATRRPVLLYPRYRRPHRGRAMAHD